MGLNAECDWDKSDTDRTTEAMYEALVNSSPPLPPQDGMPWHPVTPGKWDSRAVMREFFEDCIRIVCERGESYGPPEDNHARTAELLAWFDRWQHPGAKDSFDVCLINCLQKISRLMETRQVDGLKDLGGFAANAYACLKS